MMPKFSTRITCIDFNSIIEGSLLAGYDFQGAFLIHKGRHQLKHQHYIQRMVSLPKTILNPVDREKTVHY